MTWNAGHKKSYLSVTLSVISHMGGHFQAIHQNSQIIFQAPVKNHWDQHRPPATYKALSWNSHIHNPEATMAVESFYTTHLFCLRGPLLYICWCLDSAVSIQKCSRLSVCYMQWQLTEYCVIYSAWQRALVCLSALLWKGSAEFGGCDDMGQSSHAKAKIFLHK